MENAVLAEDCDPSEIVRFTYRVDLVFKHQGSSQAGQALP